MTNEKVAVVGLGYVGLPVCVGFAKHYPGTIGFDINKARIAELREGKDATLEVEPEVLSSVDVHYTAEVEDLKDATFIIVAVPTPIDANRQPDLRPLISASKTVGAGLQKGAVVVYESTVFPGATEDHCVPVLEEVSGLKAGTDFFIGYSPERINPGDKEHRLETIIKVVSGDSAETLERVAAAYETVVTAGVHRASSIKVAEAAKVIENTQRDINIALMNEIALIFDKLGIRTIDVLRASGTKWNFLPFRPGLVGGHCIGVDPYYLTAKAESVGYHPEVILAGRRINDHMGKVIAEKVVKSLIQSDTPVKGSNVGILGLTFKEDVPDLRNSRVPDIIEELVEYGIKPSVADPMAEPEEAMHEMNVALTKEDSWDKLDVCILAVGHQQYKVGGPKMLKSLIKPGGTIIDVKSIFEPSDFEDGYSYWSL